MQTFYTQLFSTKDEQPAFLRSLLRIAVSRLADVIAVKSELAWEIWSENAETSLA